MILVFVLVVVPRPALSVVVSFVVNLLFIGSFLSFLGFLLFISILHTIRIIVLLIPTTAAACTSRYAVTGTRNSIDWRHKDILPDVQHLFTRL